MLIDKDLELTLRTSATLTTGEGQAFTAGTAYGSEPVDMKAAGIDAAIAEPLECFVQVTVASNVGTSIRVSLVADTDGAGGSAVALLDTGVDSSTHQTNYTVAKGVRSLGFVPPGKITALMRYLTFRVIIVGSGGVSLKAWLSKAGGSAPRNAGTSIASL